MLYNFPHFHLANFSFISNNFKPRFTFKIFFCRHIISLFCSSTIFNTGFCFSFFIQNSIPFFLFLFPFTRSTFWTLFCIFLYSQTLSILKYSPPTSKEQVGTFSTRYPPILAFFFSPFQLPRLNLTASICRL